MSKSDDGKGRGALLLGDFQRDFLSPDGKMPVAQDQVTPVLEAAKRAMTYHRSAGFANCGCRERVSTKRSANEYSEAVRKHRRHPRKRVG